MKARMRGVTWHKELPSPGLDELRLLEIPYLDFAGAEQLGGLVTTSRLAEQILQIFARLRDIDFPIASIRPMVDFGGDDGLSMTANNSSCFNARRIMNSDRLSAHSYGSAIDINPVQNPVVRDGIVRPDLGARYLDRDDARPGMFVSGGAALEIFLDAGWKWGGDWTNPKDYHHFYLVS